MMSWAGHEFDLRRPKHNFVREVGTHPCKILLPTVGFLAVMEAAKWLVAGFFWIYICSASVEGKLTSRYNLFCAAAYSDRLVHAICTVNCSCFADLLKPVKSTPP